MRRLFVNSVSFYNKTLRYLYGLQHRGIKFGLRNTRMLLAAVGNPQEQFSSFHVAGTNGKGSTSSYLASIAQEAGYKTGLYTSPHLLDFTERIRIDGVPIQRSKVIQYVSVLRPHIEELKATFFEATTCMAFLHFAQEGVEIAVIETGLGGRLDATNVIRPMASIITTIGMDHMQHLGNSLTSIAREKGGIVKHGVPCITGTTKPEALVVLQRIAVQKRTRLFHARRLVRLRSSQNRWNFSARHLGVANVRPYLSGHHQIWNIQNVVATLRVLKHHRDIPVQFPRLFEPTVIRKGIEKVGTNTGIRGRYEVIKKGGKKYILDVAHNPEGMETLVRALRAGRISTCNVVFGAMMDKDVRAMIAALNMRVRVLIAVTPRTPRALHSKAICAIAASEGIYAQDGGDVRQGVLLAARLAGVGDTILVTGSHHVVAEALAELDRRNIP